MKKEKGFEEFETLYGISVEEALSVFEAISQVFPMIVSANLTKNTYTMIKQGDFLADDLPMTGRYDDLIDYGVENIHPNYQGLFLEKFSREHLLKAFERGTREVCVKLYQKGRGKNYQWVSTHVIRVKDRDGDICEICINKILGDGLEDGQQRVSRAPY